MINVHGQGAGTRAFMTRALADPQLTELSSMPHFPCCCYCCYLCLRSRVSMLLRSSMDMTFLEEVAAAAETGDGAAAGDSAAQGVEHSTLLGTSPRQGFLSPSSASNPQSSAGLHAGSSLQGMASNASAGIAQAGGPHSLQAQRSRPLSIELNKGDAQQGA